MTQPYDGQAPSPDLCQAKDAQEATRAPCILVVDADSALVGLLQEWLADYGYDVAQDCAGGESERAHFDLVVVDVPFPRQGGLSRSGESRTSIRVRRSLALSSTFFAGIERSGAIARTLGVASVLPKPFTRDALITTVRKLLHQ